MYENNQLPVCADENCNRFYCSVNIHQSSARNSVRLCWGTETSMIVVVSGSSTARRIFGYTVAHEYGVCVCLKVSIQVRTFNVQRE